ncbi:MAG: DUF2934 domain-containing protein [Lactobacillaceae bacterium]|jgi:hypothetical protein|nr:DUF2934 domain-containing protein [Lactobacillaceae bacterium]
MSKYCENSIREAAYYLWEKAGSPAGQDDYFWALAVEQLGGKSKAKSCSVSTVKKAKTSASSVKKPAVKKASATAKKAAVSSKK